MPAQDESLRYTFEQFAAIHRYQPTLAFSPDGTSIAYVSNASWANPTSGASRPLVASRSS